MIEPINEAYAITLEEKAINEEGNLAPATIVFADNGFIDLMAGDTLYFRFTLQDIEVIRKVAKMVEMPY